MVDLTARQFLILERLRARGFQFVAFPLYASYVGVKKGNCAALLAPVGSDDLKIFGEPGYLISGSMSVRVAAKGQQWFVWKKEKLEATSDRLEELRQFAAELAESLLAPS